MYSLDINLLKERTEDRSGNQTDFSTGTSIAPSKYGKTPLYIGIGVAALSLLATGGGYLWTGQQTAQLEVKQKDLDGKLGSLKVQEQRLQQVTSQVGLVTAETKSLSSVFDQVQPISSILQDLRESTPQGIQIDSIAQSDIKPVVAAVPAAAVPAAPSGGLVNKVTTVPNPEAKLVPGSTTSPTPAAVATPVGTPAATPSTPPTANPTAMLPADAIATKLSISGKAKSFDDVNNFVLTLKQSAFFNPEDIQLSEAMLTAPTPLSPLGSNAQGSSSEPKFAIPKLVTYKIQASLKRIPSADLLQELERKGAVGLVTRLKTLKQQQAIKP
jgi:type IV pilus assembly protein PilN